VQPNIDLESEELVSDVVGLQDEGKGAVDLEESPHGNKERGEAANGDGHAEGVARLETPLGEEVVVVEDAADDREQGAEETVLVDHNVQHLH